MDRESQCRATRCSTVQHGVTRGPCKGYLVRVLAHTTTLSASQHNCALQKASLVLVCISDHVSFCETFDFRLDVSTGPVVTPRWAHTSNLNQKSEGEVWFEIGRLRRLISGKNEKKQHQPGNLRPTFMRGRILGRPDWRSFLIFLLVFQ